MKKPYRLAPLVIAIGLALAACGTSGNDTTARAGTKNRPPSLAAVSVKTVDTPLGTILANGDGRTLYGFTNDANGTSTCEAQCAATWPPVTIEGNPSLATGLDPTVFTTVARSDGSSQLKAGKWPAYLFSGDAKPGDVNGQGSGGVWFVIAPDGSLVTQPPAQQTAAPAPSTAPAPPPAAPEAPAVVGTGSTSLGEVLVDPTGKTLYGFTNDSNGTSTCSDACAAAWPPLLVDSVDLPAGLDANVFSVISRNDGTYQLKAGAWPLYRYAADSAAGQTNGQGSGGVWFVAAPDGSLIKN